VLAPNSGPWGIAPGPDGALWFTEWGAGQLGRINLAGAITEYPMPANGPLSGQYSAWITAGPQGELWFTDPQLNRIGEAVFVTANLTVSPASGAYKTILTFTGSGFAPQWRHGF